MPSDTVSRVGEQDFLSRPFLVSRIRELMDFYELHAHAPSGGFVEALQLDGSASEHGRRSVVNAARYVISFAVAYRHTGDLRYKAAAARAFRFLREAFAEPGSDRYAWQVTWARGARTDVDTRLRAYGMCFVVLACARAAMAGIPAALGAMHSAYNELERVFWEAEHQLYADELQADGTLSDYRSQNTNMHAVEANLAAYEATGKAAYLARAETVARSVALGLSALGDGKIWEHYRADWSIDWDYNRPRDDNYGRAIPEDNAADTTADKYRVWGFQPGHFAEWAKLLLLLDRHLSAGWHVPCAARLFREAAQAWDAQHGGIPYAISPDGSICNGNKHYWVQTEAFAAAALLARATGEADYVAWYLRLWAYCWQTLCEHTHGSWRCVAPANPLRTLRQDERAVATGYHIVVCCDDTLRALAAPPCWGLPAAGIDDRNRP